MHQLHLDTDLDAFAQRHWTLPGQPRDALQALLLAPATPAHSPTDLALGLDWGQNRFGPILATPSPDAWQRLLRRVMRRKLRQILIRYHGPFASSTSRSRYRIPFVWDITTLLKVGEMLGLADRFYSSMLDRPAHSIEVVLLYAQVGEDYLCLPLDFHLRKPDPKKGGHPCLTAIALAQKMLEDLHHSMRLHFLRLAGHFLVADAWFTDGKSLRRAEPMDLIPIVQGKVSFVFDGTVQGQSFHGPIASLLQRRDWKWKRSPQASEVPYIRLNMKSPTFGAVTVTLCDRPGEETPDYLICLVPAVSSPRIIRAYGRRPWVEACFEVCKATLNIERFKVRTTRGSIYGFIALRFLSFALFDYAGRRVTHRRRSGGQIMRSLRYHGTLWLKQLLENKALSVEAIANRLAAHVAVVAEHLVEPGLLDYEDMARFADFHGSRTRLLGDHPHLSHRGRRQDRGHLDPLGREHDPFPGEQDVDLVAGGVALADLAAWRVGLRRAEPQDLLHLGRR